MVYNADEQLFPDWLNDEFFLQALRKFLQDDTVVLQESVILRPGTVIEEHYGSVMYRTNIRYRSTSANEEKSLALIMKTKPVAEGHKKELLDKTGIFERELEMYGRVLPEMARLLGAIDEGFKYPTYIYGALEPNAILMLEDVSGQGWQTCDFIGTLEEAKHTVQILSKFHAASVVLEHQGTDFQSRLVTAPDLVVTAFEPMIESNFKDLITFMENTEGFQKFVEPMREFRAALKEKYVHACSPSNSYLNVLTHGDFHAQNLLQRSDEHSRMIDAMLLDYQVCGWTSPVVDVYYMLDMMVAHPLKEKHRDDLVGHYHQEFCRCLKKLGYIGHLPTLAELKVELLKGAAIELFHYIVFYPIRYLDPSNADIAAMITGQVTNPALGNAEYVKVLKEELTRFLQLGVI